MPVIFSLSPAKNLCFANTLTFSFIVTLTISSLHSLKMLKYQKCHEVNLKNEMEATMPYSLIKLPESLCKNARSQRTTNEKNKGGSEKKTLDNVIGLDSF